MQHLEQACQTGDSQASFDPIGDLLWPFAKFFVNYNLPLFC